jgi:hypothetical protein
MSLLKKSANWMVDGGVSFGGDGFGVTGGFTSVAFGVDNYSKIEL